MPMQYTDEKVLESGEHWIGEKPTEESMTGYRERCAKYLEEKYQDYMAAWEVRTGREWTSMRASEAEALLTKHPSLVRNMGFLSVFLPGRQP